MNENTKPTAGAWCEAADFVDAVNKEGLRAGNGQNSICKVFGPDRAANARLIAEAGNVFSETGLTPRQLVE